MPTPPPMPPMPPPPGSGSYPPPPGPGYYPGPYEPPPRKSNTWIIVVVCVAAVLVVPSCMLSILLPSLSRAREVANRVKCGSNLRQIGQAMLLYANEHNGAYPDTIGGLLEEDISVTAFVCPASNDTPAVAGATPQASAANVQAGGHLSYVYLGKGMTNTQPANAVLVYEPLTDHRNQGMNVLFGDGHVDWVTAQSANQILAELKAGHNPPRGKY